VSLSSNSPRFAVLGGGITGLTAAHRLTQLAPHSTVEVFEASSQLGGVLSTRCEDEYLIELGADSFLKKLPWAVELCEELGLGDELLPTNPTGRRALVVRDGRLHPVPEGFVILKPHRIVPILLTPLLSLKGKLRLLRERWIGSPKELYEADFDESVASFATRRLGQEAFERLVQPLLAGIYTADPNQLSLAATMPDAIEAERDHGSLTRAILKKAKLDGAGVDNEESDSRASGARYAGFVTLRQGLKQLIETLAESLSTENFHFNTPVRSLKKNGNGRWFQRTTPRGGHTMGLLLHFLHLVRQRLWKRPTHNSANCWARSRMLVAQSFAWSTDAIRSTTISMDLGLSCRASNEETSLRQVSQV